MAITRRPRRRVATTGSVDELNALVAALIKENSQLKRQLARLNTAPAGSSSSANARALGAIALKVQRALSSSGGTRRNVSRRAPAATRTSRTRTPRKPASPETQAKRLAALARAREARAAKRVATTESGGS